MIKRAVWLVFGLLALLLGVIGIFLPLLPTTPFILLAAFCFSRSSQRLHQWLLQHPLFGVLIQDWQQHGVIRTKTKWLTTITMLVFVSYPLVFLTFSILIKIFVVVSMSCVLVFIWSRPSAPCSAE